MGRAVSKFDDPGPYLDLLMVEKGFGFNPYLERRAAVLDYHTLQAMSDAELAALGLSRAEIPGHVLRHMGSGTRAV